MINKVLVLYASYGGGHLSAARSINEFIENNYPNIQTELIDCVKYINKALEAVTTKAYTEMAKKVPNAWRHIYKGADSGPISRISTASNKVMAIKLKKLLEEKNPDLVICTHPFASQMCSYLKRKQKTNVKIATILTDFAIHNQWVVGHEYTDYFFVSHLVMKEDLIVEGVDSNKIYTTGIPLSNKFLLEYDKSQILENFGLIPGKKPVLFFGGGELGLGKTYTFDLFKSFVKNDNILSLGYMVHSDVVQYTMNGKHVFDNMDSLMSSMVGTEINCYENVSKENVSITKENAQLNHVTVGMVVELDDSEQGVGYITYGIPYKEDTSAYSQI